MSRFTLTFALTAFLVAFSSGQQTFPEEITDQDGVTRIGPLRKCSSTTESALDTCLQQIVDELSPIVPNGIPEFGLQPLDPMYIKKLDLNFKLGPIDAKLHAKNTKVEGMAQYNKLNFKVHTQNNTLRYEYEVPKVVIDTTYKLGGVAIIPLQGSGPAHVEATKVRVVGSFNYKRTTREDGVYIVQLDSTTVDDMTIGGLQLRARGLFNGNPVISGMVHYVANNFGPQVFEFIQPNVAKIITGILTDDLLNPILKNLPYLVDYVQH